MKFAQENYVRLRLDSTSEKRVLDPQEPFLQRWNKIFVLVCVISVSLDPLFFYTPVIDGKRRCLKIDKHVAIAACILRSFTDVFYILRIILKFHTGFVVPSTRVSGRGELITDHYVIAKRYLRTYFLVDILAILPLPQVVILVIIPKVDGLVALTTKDMLKFVVLCQYIPRCFRIYPLLNEATSSSGLLPETAWAGAALNLFLYMLASHIVGAFWYLISVERKDKCWRDACKGTDCNIDYLYCGTVVGEHNSILSSSCPLLEPEDIKKPTDFDFGIFLYALKSNVVEMKDFPRKFLYCFWWGLRSLSSLGQNLNTSSFAGEVIFAIAISIVGLVLFSLLIGNMQKYLLQSIAISAKEEEMREKRKEVESWMSQRMLPQSLRERIKRYKEYKWQKTKGIDEELLIRDLPKDLRRDINRHLRLSFLKRVPLFAILEERLLDAMCDRLKPVLYPENSYIFREGDAVDEMLFVTRGKIETVTTNGRTSGFFNRFFLKAGDFCGEELLTWAMHSRSSSSTLPLSTRTVKALSAVEAFALMAEDLRFVASEFLLHKQVPHIFRYYSPEWRTWAACFIQAAWRRYCRRRIEKSLYENEERLQNALARESGTTPSLGTAIYATRFAANALQALRRNRVPSATRFAANALQALRRNRVPSANLPHDVPPLLIPKPTEPDFDAESNNIEIVVAK